MYRALPSVNGRLLTNFSLESDINKSWQKLKEALNIEAFSSGAGMGKFTTYRPGYTGSRNARKADGNMFYAWGIDSYYDEKSDSLSYKENKDTSKIDTIAGFSGFKAPVPDEFDLDIMTPDMELAKDNMLGAGTLNSIFMIAMYLRGANNLLIELMTDKKLAHYYIDMIGEFACELNRQILKEDRT